MYSLFLLVIGFVALLTGGTFLVNGASSIAKKFKLSNLMIGLTIVSFGTSAPELLVNILASLNGQSDLAIGNILGSNLSNIFLILGITAMIYPLKVTRGTTWKEIPFSLLAIVALALMVNDSIIDGNAFTVLSRIDGLLLMLFFIVFLYYTFGIGGAEGEEEEIKEYPISQSLLMFVGGCVGLGLGGQWVVDGASAIARNFGLSEAFIGLTMVALGTSLPELVTSVIAAMKKQADIAVGNVVGSNIFNIVWILGLSSSINPIVFNPALNTDLMLVVFATLVLFVSLFIGKKHTLYRWEGASFVGLYVVYVVFLFFRG